MKIDGTEVDEYGFPAEAARAYEQMKHQYPTATVQERPRLPGAEPAYAIVATRQERVVELSLEVPDEGTAWINANSQLGPKIGS